MTIHLSVDPDASLLARLYEVDIQRCGEHWGTLSTIALSPMRACEIAERKAFEANARAGDLSDWFASAVREVTDEEG
jgi:hypothetical protein